ncbi:MAG: Aspartate-semialdehyde dehydrogenase [Owenweeksia sp. TMED14]|nr:MAG: Aspartate-semialdehyde dehydrogenase [Owenweeksia sp. TMED14]
MRLALIGVTGMVGEVLLDLLLERQFPISTFIPVASSKSHGKTIEWKGDHYNIISPEEALFQNPDLAIFTAGSEVSKKYAQLFAKQGCYVIDNSSAWRMSHGIPLVVPEINCNMLNKNSLIIANPNCSTIQLVMALKPIHDAYPITRVIVSTYQSVSGSGRNALDQLNRERNGDVEGAMEYPYQIDMNCIPHCDVFLENDYTKEEMKLTNESKKILDDMDIHITATAVRVPVKGGHSESVNIEFRNDRPSVNIIRSLLAAFPGVKIQDFNEGKTYPMPIYAEGKNDVFVGRIRNDISHPKAINLWIVSDNLRKGAALNALQIAENLISKHLLAN